MRGFVVLCLVAVVAADKLGYDYRPVSRVGPGSVGFGRGGISNGVGSSGGSIGLGGGVGGGIGGGLTVSNSLGGGYVNGGGIGSSIGNSGLGGGLGLGGGNGGGLISSGAINSGHPINAPAPVVTEYNKEFYFHSAPEEEFHDAGASQRITSTLKKNLRVVFIKAPENNGLTNAALQIARQATEDKTAIYVLTKENDISQLSQQLQQIQENKSQKPEVRFIKYRTNEDAINAQRTIQAQYDALGGSSKSLNEGVAPVLNYASNGPVRSHHESGSELLSAGSITSGNIAVPAKSYIPPKNNYLPPVAF